ncbi:unnamed protein product [Urochloa decumbens]|uniref:FBD domain-containing protein n=1 Tax=Urochloa decumbens TaxID=240449 RepID=A0ABC9E783_9POAL
METEATAPHAKKRRTEEGPERRQEPEEIASHSPPNYQPPRRPHPKPATTEWEEPRGGEERPLGAGSGEGSEGVDRISGLPDAILGDIISLLSTKDGIRTQTLASRWRHLWLSAPLNIDGRSLPADEQFQEFIISRILARHPGPVWRFSLYAMDTHTYLWDSDAWLRSPALDNLQELELGVLPQPQLMLTSPPDSVFRFSATLRVLNVSRFHLPDAMVETLHFPQLSHLGLEVVKVSDDALHRIIAGCPVLEYLLLLGNLYLDHLRLRINSPSLRGIGMSSGKLIIEDAPLLERLLQLQTYPGMNVSVISAPKLKMLGCFSDSGYCDSKLVFGTTVIQVVTFTTVVYSVKILSISIYNHSQEVVINLMRCFPCLEKLYVQFLYRSSVSRNIYSWRPKHHNLITGFDIRLKTVVLKNYQGTKSQVNFGLFFLLNAKMLELLEFKIGHHCDNNQMFVAEQHRLLQQEKSA